MATFAKLDSDNKVIQILTVGDSDAPTEADGIAFLHKTFKTSAATVTWKQGSRHTIKGKYYTPEDPSVLGDQSKAFRLNAPGVGDTYDAALDGFIKPQPFPSWIQNNTTGHWDSPIPQPDPSTLPKVINGGTGAEEEPIAFRWNEATYQADNTQGWEAT